MKRRKIVKKGKRKKLKGNIGELMFDTQNLIKIANSKMPFGKYQGTYLIDLPEPYVVWFSNQGFPPGKLGELLELTLQIKINGLEKLIYPLRTLKP